MITFYEKMNDLLTANIPFVTVTIVDTVGSVPNDVKAKMLVTENGLYFGTVGGGKVEARAIQEAKQLLSGELAGSGQGSHFVNWSLSKDIGMTCGGAVKLYFEVFNLNSWQIVIFGAGHVANALVNLLVNLDCRITCIDPREEWLHKMPQSTKLKTVLAPDMPMEVGAIPDSAFVLLMTMGHSSDKPILLEILKSWNARQFPYLGVIGSKAKAARLSKDIEEAGLPKELNDVFFCPIGLPVGSNHPQEIAISVAAQLLEMRDRQGIRASGKQPLPCDSALGSQESN